MPAGSKIAKAESALKSEARKKGLKGDAADRYIYGALNNMDMMRGSRPTKKGLAKAKKK